jgi:hypothetical protein
MFPFRQWLRLIALLPLFYSCSKSSENPETKTPACTLESVTELFDGAVTRALFYSYDQQGRVSRVDFDRRQSATYETYTYSPDRIVVSGTAPGGGTAVYNLDANGRVAKYGAMTFSYNNEGYLARALEVNGPHSTDIGFTYQNGNLVRVNQVGHYGGPQPLTTTLLFEYDAAAEAVSTIPPGDPLNAFGSARSILASYFGKGSKNLVKKETAKTSNSPDEVRTHTYTRDSKGNITSVRTAVSDGRVGEKRLTYGCK